MVEIGLGIVGGIAISAATVWIVGKRKRMIERHARIARRMPSRD